MVRWLLVSAVLWGSIGVAEPTAQAAPPKPSCGGRQATIVGTSGDDRLSGTNGPDVIVGGGGRDTINPGNGDDIVCAGAGDDVVAESNGVDVVFGQGGSDTLRGGNGDDRIDGGSGTDVADGGRGSDTCISSESRVACESIPQPAVTAVLDVQSCRPSLSLSVSGPDVVSEGDEVVFDAELRSDPAGPCLGGANDASLRGALRLATSLPSGATVSDIAMWLERPLQSTSQVLPSVSGLITDATVPFPGGCPGGVASGCSSTIQQVVGNVNYPDGSTPVLSSSTVTVPFEYFAAVPSTELQAPGVELAVAVTTTDGRVEVVRSPVTFGASQSIGSLRVRTTSPTGVVSVIDVAGDLAPGQQISAPAVATYEASATDPDMLRFSFEASGGAGGAVAAPRVDRTVLVTVDSSIRPVLQPAVWPFSVVAGVQTTLFASVRPVGDAASVAFEVGGQSGSLVDDGTSGDLIAGDGTFSAEIVVALAQRSDFTVTAEVDGQLATGSVVVDVVPVGAPTAAAPPGGPIVTIPYEGVEAFIDRLVVQMDVAASYEDVVAAAATIGGTVVGRVSQLWWQIAFPPVSSPAELEARLAAVASMPLVTGVEPEGVVATSDVVPNDPRYGEQDHLRQVDLPSAWAVSPGTARRVTVAVIDTGVDLDHPDLQGALVPGIDLTDDTATPDDGQGHGTHVAGIIGARSNNGFAGAGVNWNVALVPVKIFEDGNLTTGDAMMAFGIAYAVARGTEVLNLSVGRAGRKEYLAETLQQAWLAGRTVVAAAGNQTSSEPSYPAGFERRETFSSWFGTSERSYITDVIAVGNVDGQGRRAPDSNYGSWVDVAAPGQNVLSTTWDGLVGRKSGTSMATPVVSGIVSLILAADGGVTPDLVRLRLVNTGTPSDQQVGPIVNAFGAVVNGGFEAGFSGWRGTGTLTLLDRLGPIRAPQGSRMMSMSTGPDGAQTQATLRKEFRVPVTAVSGGSIRVSMRYNVLTEEYPEYVGSNFNDVFTVKLVLATGGEITLLTESVNTVRWTPVSGIDFPGGDNTVGQSGWRLVQALIPAQVLAGSTGFELVITDVGDTVYDSVALIDDIRVR